MSWLNGLSTEERLEMYEDAIEAFKRAVISEEDLRRTLAKLGYNASDIEAEIKNAMS
jgi:hypothetical protein